jgi:hypothetical protein
MAPLSSPKLSSTTTTPGTPCTTSCSSSTGNWTTSAPKPTASSSTTGASFGEPWASGSLRYATVQVSCRLTSYEEVNRDSLVCFVCRCILLQDCRLSRRIWRMEIGLFVFRKRWCRVLGLLVCRMRCFGSFMRRFGAKRGLCASFPRRGGNNRLLVYYHYFDGAEWGARVEGSESVGEGD